MIICITAKCQIYDCTALYIKLNTCISVNLTIMLASTLVKLYSNNCGIAFMCKKLLNYVLKLWRLWIQVMTVEEKPSFSSNSTINSSSVHLSQYCSEQKCSKCFYKMLTKVLWSYCIYYDFNHYINQLSLHTV